jgi:signal transduction histidine kinase
MPDTLQAERQRIAHALHGGIVQQITALSLAIDSALLHDGDGRHHEVSAALRTARELADLVVQDCRGLLDGLRGPGAGGHGLDGPGGA